MSTYIIRKPVLIVPALLVTNVFLTTSFISGSIIDIMTSQMTLGSVKERM